jgi:hypothetical protein
MDAIAGWFRSRSNSDGGGWRSIRTGLDAVAGYFMP